MRRTREGCCSLHRVVESGAGEQTGGVEGGEGRVRVVHEERDLGAAEYDGVAAFVALHAGDELLEVRDCFGTKDAVDELVHDDAVDGGAFRCGGPDVCDAALGELLRVDVAFDQVAGAGERETPEAACSGLASDNAGNM